MRIFCPAMWLSFVSCRHAAAGGERPGTAPPMCRRVVLSGCRRTTRHGGRTSRRPAAAAPRLLRDLRDPARADGAPALADREAQTLLHRDGLDQLDLPLGVVARHH